MDCVSQFTGRWAVATRAAILEQNPDLPKARRLRVPAFVLFVETKGEVDGWEFPVHTMARLHELWEIMQPKQVDLILASTDDKTAMVAAIAGSNPLDIDPWRENVALTQSGDGPISDVVDAAEPPLTLH